MAGTRERATVWDWVWVLAFGVASSIYCLKASAHLSAVFDEPTYLNRGLERWRSGECKGLMRLGTMPLPVDVQTLPLYVWERWRGQPFDVSRDFERLLPVARSATLLFWWVLLIHGWLGGRHLAGRWGGRLAVALLACEPSFLAHATLATTDLAASACLLGLVYHFRVGRDAGWFRRLAVPTVWFAAAVLAKASGLVFGPICLLAVEAERRGWVFRLWCFVVREHHSPLTTHHSLLTSETTHPAKPLRDLAWIVGGGLALVFLYCGSEWKPESTFIIWARQLPEGTLRQGMVWLSENLCIFSNAGEGLIQQIKHNVRGHNTYLFGREYDKACWYYFLILPTIKLSLAVLGLATFLLLRRPRALLNWAFVAALTVFLFSPAFRVQLGIRLLLPLTGLAVVGLAGTAVQTWRSFRGSWSRGVFATSLGAGVAWTAAGAVMVWPHGLSFTNELYGGTANGYLCVSDTDYDWGQGLKELLRWQKQQGLAKLDVWYFGTDPRLDRLPVRAVQLQLLPLEGPDDVLAEVDGRYLAVSTTLLYGGYAKLEAHRHAVAFLRSCQPVARTTTFFIYDFTHEGAATAWNEP
jgi:hypothetical protein